MTRHEMKNCPNQATFKRTRGVEIRASMQERDRLQRGAGASVPRAIEWLAVGLSPEEILAATRTTLALICSVTLSEAPRLSSGFVRVCLFPQLPCEGEGVDIEGLPPGNFVTGLVELPMMSTTDRDGELVADFDP